MGRRGVVPRRQDARRRAGLRHDERQAAVVVHEVEPELAAAQRRREEPQRRPVLAAVLGLPIRALGHGRPHRAERRRQRRVADGQRVGGRPEAQHHLGRPGARQIGGAEVAAHRVDLRPLPLVLVERLEGGVGVGREAQFHGAHRQQRVAQLRPGHPQGTDVNGVDGVDAALDEGALAPVDHLQAAPDLARQRAGLEPRPQERIAELRPAADALPDRVRQGRARAVALLVLDVVEREGADEAADVVVADLELAGDLRGVGEQPLLVVQVAIVTVHREGRASGRQANQALVGVRQAEAHAVGDRVVPVPLEG